MDKIAAERLGRHRERGFEQSRVAHAMRATELIHGCRVQDEDFGFRQKPRWAGESAVDHCASFRKAAGYFVKRNLTAFSNSRSKRST